MVAVFDVQGEMLASLETSALRLADLYAWSRYLAQYPIRQKLARKMRPNFTSASPSADQDQFLSLEVQLVDGPQDDNLPTPCGGPVAAALAAIDQPCHLGRIDESLRQLASYAPQVVESVDFSDLFDLVVILDQQVRFLSRRLRKTQLDAGKPNSRRQQAVQLGWARSADVIWILQTLHKPRVTRHQLRHWADRELIESKLTEQGARLYSVVSVLNFVDTLD